VNVIMAITMVVGCLGVVTVYAWLTAADHAVSKEFSNLANMALGGLLTTMPALIKDWLTRAPISK
jgi:hypothetical protein